MSFALIQVDAAPHLWRELMDISADAFEAGARLYPQVAARPFGMLIGFAGNHAFTHRPTYRALAHLSPDERALELVKPAVKAAILSETDLPIDPTKQFDGLEGPLPERDRPHLRDR